MKRYIWGFPGIGKSNVRAGLRVEDADCECFKYKNVSKEDLHSGKRLSGVSRNDDYPQNYLNHIQTVSADIVLLNCHVNLLEQLDKDQVLLVYPGRDLIPEYLQRYRDRGDHNSFVSYMEVEAPGMIDYIQMADFEKYAIQNPNMYLSDLFERNDFKMKLMTRTELTDQLQRAIDLDVMIATYQAGDNARLVCDAKYCGMDKKELQSSVNCAVERKSDAAQLAEAVLDGKYQLDIDQLMGVCAKREEFLQQEKEKDELRGGLSREELEDKIMQGIVNGALGIHHGQIAPYSYGYEVFYKDENYQRSWHCYCNFFNIPKTIVDDIENARQSRSNTLNIHELLATIEKKEGEKITSFTPASDTDFVRAKKSYQRGSIASVKDVHAGKGLDGIVQGHYQGDYSSITTNSQNSLVRTLVCMKGFCLDCLPRLDIGPDGRNNVVDYLRRHGTDVSTPEKLRDWIMHNPELCGLEANRERFRASEADREFYAHAYTVMLALKDNISHFTGSLEEFCEKYDDLYGDMCDDAWRGSFDVLEIGIVDNHDGTLSLEDEFSIWSPDLDRYVEECISFEDFKKTCARIGLEVEDPEASSKGKSRLDDRIANAAAKAREGGVNKQKEEDTRDR